MGCGLRVKVRAWIQVRFKARVRFGAKVAVPVRVIELRLDQVCKATVRQSYV